MVVGKHRSSCMPGGGSMNGMIGLGLFVAVLGIAMALWGLTQRSKANALVGAARTWPTVPAIMTGTEIVRGGSNRAPTFSPVVRYEYELEGRKYVGTRLRAGYVKVGSRGAAERMLQPYPVGASVPVRYDPADIQSSLLELETSSSPMLMAVIGVVLVLFGGAMAILAATGSLSGGSGRSSRAAAPALLPGSAVAGTSAASANAAGPQTRTWRGSYVCGQGESGLEVTLRPLGQGRLAGTLSFFPLPANPTVPRGCFRVTGQADAAGGIELRGSQWVRRPPDYHMIDLSGRLGANDGISGRVVDGACGQFQVQLVSSPVESCQ